MTKLTAIIRHSHGGNITHLTGEYKTKKEFKEDLKGNGLIVITIYNDKQINEIKETRNTIEFGYAQDYVKQML